MSLTTRFLSLAGILILAGTFAFAQPSLAVGQHATAFPPVGLGSTETAEVILFNSAPNPTTGPAASCAGSVTFTNAGGTTIGTPGPFTAASGQIVTVRLAFGSAAASGARTEIRASIQTTVPTTNPRPACSLQTGFSTFDTVSGATHVYLQGPSLVSFRD